MFIDQIKMTLSSGHGGAGHISFLREKFKPWGGPDGGDGGRGGHVYIVGDARMNSFAPYRFKRKRSAQTGINGQKRDRFGGDGEDLFLGVPLGTVVKNFETGEIITEILEDKQQHLLLKGGRGGKGNAFFKTATHQAPRFAQPGEEGQTLEVFFELKLIADVGLVGMPNAGKSTLLSVLTSARPKIADYPFTTLSPNLGVFEYDQGSLVIADIPGLIEGASSGAGLGDEFLRHVERTKFLIHVVDASGQNGDPIENYKMIQKELASNHTDLSTKPQWVVFNKIDLVPDLKEFQKTVKKIKAEKIFYLSAASQQGLEELKNALMEFYAQSYAKAHEVH
jgi:GTP-binding protein